MAIDIYNRDEETMSGYLEARIEALKRKNAELEADNRRLRAQLDLSQNVETVQNITVRQILAQIEGSR